ncbi:hypothetical protein PYCC9005_000880 [Savitreella phatthalungensis]
MVVIHIDLDFFYGAVEVRRDPRLAQLPFAIQQKHIVVTANYLARKRGVRKLQLLTEAKRACPDLAVVSGEDITHYRQASKEVFVLLRGLLGNRVERLGLDEFWCDVRTHVDSEMPGSFPGHLIGALDSSSDKHRRLQAGARLAEILRHRIHQELGFTSSAGIAMSRVLAKLVGNEHKPNDQTTIVPEAHGSWIASVPAQRIPGIGYSMLKRLFAELTSEPPVVPRTTDNQIQFTPALHPSSPDGKLDELDLSEEVNDEKPQLFAKEILIAQNRNGLLAGRVRDEVSKQMAIDWFGKERGEWLVDIVHGVDYSEVRPSALFPGIISVEDSFIHCTSRRAVEGKLIQLTQHLHSRMKTDLTEHGRWARWPSKLRLTPRFRTDSVVGLKDYRDRHRRVARSVDVPAEIFEETFSEWLAIQIVTRTLMPLFDKLVSNLPSWDLSLLNVGVYDIRRHPPNLSIATMLRQAKHHEYWSDEQGLDGDEVEPDQTLYCGKCESQYPPWAFNDHACRPCQ